MRSSVAGPFEQIHLQHLLGNQTPQITNLSSELRFTRFLKWLLFANGDSFALFLPSVQGLPRNTNFLRKVRDIFTRPETFESPMAEVFRMFPNSLIIHLRRTYLSPRSLTLAICFSQAFIARRLQPPAHMSVTNSSCPR
jgi:hypothetical protein